MKINSSKGATFTEYSILIGLLAILAIPGIMLLGGSIQSNFNETDELLSIAEGVGAGDYNSIEEGRVIRELESTECFIGTNGNDAINSQDLADYGCVYGLNGNDTIETYNLSPMAIYPGLGNDIITSVGTNITLFYEGGDDTFEENGPNTTLNFGDLTYSDVTISPANLSSNPTTKGWNGYMIQTPNGSITLPQALHQNYNHKMERVVFSDITQIHETLRYQALNSQSTSGDDLIYGTEYEETILDQGGNDTVRMGEGDDLYRWTQGADVIDFNKGFDTLQINGYNYADATLSIDRWDLHITVGGETIKISDGARYQHTESNFKLMYLEFDDQTLDMPTLAPIFVDAQITAGEARVEGTGYDDIITPQNANSIISPGAGDDTIIYSTGTFRIHGDAQGYQINPGNDTLDLSIYEVSDVLNVYNDNGDAVITLPDGEVKIEWQFQYPQGEHPALSIDIITFSDATWNEADLRTQAGL